MDGALRRVASQASSTACSAKPIAKYGAARLMSA
jgi:hypothetical protein